MVARPTGGPRVDLTAALRGRKNEPLHYRMSGAY